MNLIPSGTYQSISIYYRLSDLPNKFSFNIPYTDTVKLFCDACSGVRYNFMHIHFNVYNNDAMDVARRSKDRKASQYSIAIKLLVMHSVPLCSCYWPSRGMHQRCLIGRTSESIPWSRALVSSSCVASRHQEQSWYPAVTRLIHRSQQWLQFIASPCEYSKRNISCLRLIPQLGSLPRMFRRMYQI